MKGLLLALALALAAGACAPIYYCETEFGQTPPLVNAKGEKYWPSTCFPQNRYEKAKPLRGY